MPVLKHSYCRRQYAAFSSHLGLHFRFALLGDKRLPHAKGYARLVHGLVRRNGHVDLISHAQQQQSPFRAVYCHLPDQLVFRNTATTGVGTTVHTIHYSINNKLSLLCRRIYNVYALWFKRVPIVHPRDRRKLLLREMHSYLLYRIGIQSAVQLLFRKAFIPVRGPKTEITHHWYANLFTCG